MDWIVAIVLGVLQGIAEWLPISSQGQVMAFSMALFNTPATEALKYAVWLHVGTLIAATIYFRKTIIELLQLKDKKLLKWLIIATLSTGITAAPLYLFLKHTVSVAQASFVLLLIGILLIVTGILQKKVKESAHKKETNSQNAIITGLAQGLSVLPGISRSGTTVAALLFQGFSAEKSFVLSFLMSIPAVLAAEIIFGLDEGFALDPFAFLAMLIALVVGYITLEKLIEFAKKASFWKFCIGFGIFLILIFLMGF
ncbi:MAG: undecaprenyl-diphosphate phosphatase [Candidatus Diapherotrites archaeon]|nr:undecaprenyl-diphosphate phosphatase [Candidatus Diapherotrites archaeon]